MNDKEMPKLSGWADCIMNMVDRVGVSNQQELYFNGSTAQRLNGSTAQRLNGSTAQE